MTILRTIVGLGLAFGLSACAANDGVSRNQPFQTPGFGSEAATVSLDNLSISNFSFAMPDGLRISEANSYYPIADIVWRGDPMGDRRQQVTDIFGTAMSRASAGLRGDRPVDVVVELDRFHSVTDRTRWTIGGTHSIKFYITVRDARTGDLLIDRQFVSSDLAAFGGEAAYRAEARGETQKVRVTAHLAQVLARVVRGLPIDA